MNNKKSNFGESLKNLLNMTSAVMAASVLFVVLIACVASYAAQKEFNISDVPNLIHVPTVRQGTNYTCGVASLQSILMYYGIDSREDKLSKSLNVNGDHARADEIKSYSESIGFKVTQLHNMTAGELRKQIDKKNPVMICLQAWEDEGTTSEQYKNIWDAGHWVVVIGYDKNNFYFMDPSTMGNYTYIPVNEFLVRWHDKEDGTDFRYIHFGMSFEAPNQAVYDPMKITKLE